MKVSELCPTLCNPTGASENINKNIIKSFKKREKQKDLEPYNMNDIVVVDNIVS